MGATMSERAAALRTIETREAVQAAGNTLTDFLKSGPRSSSHTKEIQEQITAIVSAIVRTPEMATKNYKATCREFLENVKQVKGMPARAILGGGGSGSNVVSASGDHVSKKFPTLLPSIMERFDWCVETYGVQSKLYFDYQLSQFQELLRTFLEEVPAGGSRDKALKSRISEIKSELRALIKWDQLFDIYKQGNFAAEVEYVFKLESNPIAAVWRYSSHDEEGEYQKTYNHKQRDGHFYTVRSNWALEKALMKVGPDGYLDEISRPQQELGCMCYLTWIYHLRDLPNSMVTELGTSELTRVRAVIAAMQKETPAPKSSAAKETKSAWSRLARWFGRR